VIMSRDCCFPTRTRDTDVEMTVSGHRRWGFQQHSYLASVRLSWRRSEKDLLGLCRRCQIPTGQPSRCARSTKVHTIRMSVQSECPRSRPERYRSPVQGLAPVRKTHDNVARVDTPLSGSSVCSIHSRHRKEAASEAALTYATTTNIYLTIWHKHSFGPG